MSQEMQALTFEENIAFEILLGGEFQIVMMRANFEGENVAVIGPLQETPDGEHQFTPLAMLVNIGDDDTKAKKVYAKIEPPEGSRRGVSADEMAPFEDEFSDLTFNPDDGTWN